MARMSIVLGFLLLMVVSPSLSKKKREVASVFDHRVRVTACPSVVASPSHVDFDQLAGSWIQYGVYGYKQRSRTPECSYITFSAQSGILSMIEKKHYRSFVYTRPSLLTAEEDGGRYDVKVEEKETKKASRKGKTTVKTSLYVLDTDHHCYAVTFKCKQIQKKKYGCGVIESSLLLRNNGPACLNDDVRAKFQNFIETNVDGVDLNHIKWFDISTCQIKVD